MFATPDISNCRTRAVLDDLYKLVGVPCAPFKSTNPLIIRQGDLEQQPDQRHPGATLRPRVEWGAIRKRIHSL